MNHDEINSTVTEPTRQNVPEENTSACRYLNCVWNQVRDNFGKKSILGIFLLSTLLGLLFTSICVEVWYMKLDVDDPSTPPGPSSSIMGVYDSAAVVSAGAPCAAVGQDILARGGSAIDAAIAILLCDGVCVFQSLGVGGGFVMTIYDKPNSKVHSLIAREKAPAAATWNMFINRSFYPARMAGVPGELKGYQEAHKKFGKLPWKDLFEPTVSICEQGCAVSRSLANGFKNYADVLKASPTFNDTILSQIPGRLPMEGDIIKHPQLARTLRKIASSPRMTDEFYKGSLTKGFVEDIRSGDGIITEEDMNNYEVRWEEPYNATLPGGLTVFSPALPGSGILITFMLELLSGFSDLFSSQVDTDQVIVETFKHAYGLRTQLSDPYFDSVNITKRAVSHLNDDEFIRSIRSKISLHSTSQNMSFYGDISHIPFVSDRSGTSNIAVVAPDGSAVVVTSTINTLFSNAFVSKSTGILLNNQLWDFNFPPFTSTDDYRQIVHRYPNHIQPGKIPLACLSPTLVLDGEKNVRLAVGTAGANLITTTTALVAVRNLWLGRNIKQAIDEPRFHHNLNPMHVTYERGVVKEVVDNWRAAGHKVVRYGYGSLAVCTAIAREGDKLTVSADWRKPGYVAGF